MKLGSVRIFVRDMGQAKSFYADRLGLAVEIFNEEHGFCMFDTGSTKLIVELVGSDADADDQQLVGRLTGLCFPVEDIKSKHLQLAAIGIEFTSAPELQYWGGWLATFEDPSGNGLQLVQQPA